MPTLPRLIIVDPPREIPEQIRGALTLVDRLAIQIDVPGALEALEELKRGKATALIMAWEPGDNMRGWELAARVNRIDPDLPMIVLADYDDTELDEETLKDSPFIYLKRPYDVTQFLRVLTAALDGKNLAEALFAPVVASSGAVLPQFGAVPQIDPEKARGIIHKFMTDLNAMAVLLVTRDGKVLVEQGTLGYIKREELASALVGSSVTHLTLRDMLAGAPTLFQFFDGETYDLFVLSAGYHHLVVVLFDGQRGNRELGAVRSFGRRATEDLISLIGAEALLMSLPTVIPDEEPTVAHRPRARVARAEDEPVALARANIVEPEPAPAPAAATPVLEAIEGDLDLDALFGSGTDMDADSLFSLDNLAAELSKIEDKSSGGKLDWDRAQELGLLGGE